MESFESNALGSPFEYRAYLSDQVMLIVKAKNPDLLNTGAELPCRPVGDPADYQWIRHTYAQLGIVLADMDRWELTKR